MMDTTYLLSNNDDLYNLVRFIIQKAGLALPIKLTTSGERESEYKNRDIAAISWELDHSRDKRIKLITGFVLRNDVNTLRQLANKAFEEDRACPRCKRASRVRFRVSSRDYICGFNDCKEVWRI